ncbi:TolC family protein [Winogradskyella sp. A3E31]|uniref:TolC family protein n=1 Tax=Winogradskyella sp. A3E31 TaxID=3349637 RepID=UPI00398B9D04
MRKPLITLLIFLVPVISFTQEVPNSFTLEEAIAFALENNRTSKNAQRDIEAAKEQQWETIATGLPQIDASASYQNNLKQQVSLVPAEFFGGQEGEFAEVVFGTKQNVNATATLNQLIFDGSYLVGLQASKVFLEISKNAKEKTDLEVRKMVINAYGNVLISQESEAILEKNKTILAENLDETQKIYENGLEEEESVEQLRITLAEIESALKNATRLKNISQQLLNITLGININTDISLTDSLENLAAKNVSLALLTEDSSVENTIDFKIAQNDVRSKELMVKLEKSKALPRLTGYLNGGYLGFSDDFTFFDSDQNWSGFSSFGLNLNIPIFSSFGRKAKTQRAEINLDIAEENLTELEQQINLQIETAKSNYQFAIEDYNIKKDNLQLAERIEAKNQTKFFEGIASSFELRQAQNQLYSAQNAYLEAMLNVINTKTELETALNLPNNN